MRHELRSAAPPTRFPRRPGDLKLLTAVVLLLAAGCAVAVAVAARWALPADADVLTFAERHYRASVVNPLDVALKITLGVAAVAAVGALIAFLTGRAGSRALFWALALGGPLALDFPLKEIFHRPALGNEGGGYSFPSGNAMASAALLTAVALTASPSRRRAALVLGIPSLVLYGAALVYSWWHYPSDVVGGWCLGAAWTAALWAALPRPSSGTARERCSAPGRPWKTTPSGRWRVRRASR